MKLSTLAQRLMPVLSVMQCPLCGSPFSLNQQSLTCTNGHCFDLSTKGYVNLAPSHLQAKEKYDTALFASRSKVFADGFYAPVLSAIMQMLTTRFAGQAFSLLDVGCGEGYYAREIANLFPSSTVLGLDLSRDAITAAARGANQANWLVANLKQLPIASRAVDIVLDVLTPADYAEFGRVLAADGELIKVVPGSDYLQEVRAAVANHLQKDSYDNSQVISHLEERMGIIERVVIRETTPLTPEQAAHFLRMTPMTFSVPTEELECYCPSSITIHMEILRCRMK